MDYMIQQMIQSNICSIISEYYITIAINILRMYKTQNSLIINVMTASDVFVWACISMTLFVIRPILTHFGGHGSFSSHFY